MKTSNGFMAFDLLWNNQMVQTWLWLKQYRGKRFRGHKSLSKWVMVSSNEFKFVKSSNSSKNAFIINI